jgi:hypothetical protein
MSIPKDVSIYNKINSFGVVFISIILLFQFSVGFYSISNTTYTYSEEKYDEYLDELSEDPDTPYLAFIKFFSVDFPPLMGILGGGFYFHNISLSVCKNSRYPEKNLRDVFLGYLATCLTYICCGVLGYYGFIGSAFESKINAPDNTDHLIEDNSLNMFGVKSVGATFIRFCAFA